MDLKSARVAFVHDWLTGMRGGEKVLEAALELFPQAEIYTLLYRPDQVSELIRARRVHVSWLDFLPGAHRYYRYLLPLMPWAIESFDLGDYDLVVSFSHCAAKGVRIASRSGRRGPPHLCYCFTPMRYVYEQFQDYFSGGAGAWLRLGLAFLRPALARWDKKNSRDVDFFSTSSENVRRRIQNAYGRDAKVIHPPAAVDFFSLPRSREHGEPYYLFAGALVPYKRADLAITACRALGVRLKIVGAGTEDRRLKDLARGASVEFLGRRSDEELRTLYQNCEAFLFPADEDFGITAVEAMACGRPVIAYKKGGSLETVLEGVTGVFFGEQTAEALAEAMARAGKLNWDGAAIRSRSLEFSNERFKSGFMGFVQEAWDKRLRTRVMEVVECGGAGGTWYQVAALCNGLDPSRFESDLVYSVRPGNFPKDYEVLARGAERFFYMPEMRREVSPLWDLKAFWGLRRIFKRRRPDVVHAHSSKAGFLARLAAWVIGIPRIYYSPRGYSFLRTDCSALSRMLYRFLERLASRIGEVVAVSDSEADLARGLGARVTVVRDAYLGETPKAAPKAGKRVDAGAVVCAAGRLSAARNPEAFLRLAGRLKKSRGGARCVWIGGGYELEGAVEKMIRDLELADFFELTGWLKHEAALDRLSRADIFVHYSSWDAIPNAVLEAMALGLPVVASDIPANRGLIFPGRNGFLAATEDELLEMTLKLIDDPGLRAFLGAAGRDLARREYSRERLIKEISGLYRGAFSNPRMSLKRS